MKKSSADRFIESFELYTEGLDAVSPGVCGGCSQCLSDSGFKFGLEHVIVDDHADKIVFRDKVLKKEIFAVAMDDLAANYPGEDPIEAAKDEFRFSDPDIPNDVMEAAFSSLVESGDVADECGFSWSSCDTCGTSLGGDRYAARAIGSDGELIHLDVCADCVFFMANGDIPEDWE